MQAFKIGMDNILCHTFSHSFTNIYIQPFSYEFIHSCFLIFLVLISDEISIKTFQHRKELN
jgi:hypothetical protein